MSSSQRAFNPSDSKIYITDIGDHILQIQFTRREIEILKLIKQGKTTKIIAAELNISAFTVKKHRENMMSKVEAENMTELVVVVSLNGLL